MKVLIVDDDAINRKLLRIVLQNEGYEIVEAKNGQEGLDTLIHEEISLIISDILMPKMDGYHFCQEVRKRERFDKIHFLFYSSTYTSPADENLAKSIGGDAFFKRPASNQDIIDAVNHYINKPRSKPDTLANFDKPNLLKQYNNILVKKLEDKNIELHDRLEQLQATRSQFQMVVENIHEVFFIIDPVSYQFEYISPAYSTIWGKPIEELYNDPNNWIENVIEEDKFKFEDLVEISQFNTEIEFRILHPSNQMRWIKIQTFPVYSDSDDSYQIVGIAEDITDYKQLLANYQHFEKMDSLGKMASGIAHDFNNILMVIQSCSDIVLKKLNDQADIRKELENIKQAAKSGAKLTGQLLTLGKAQAFHNEIFSLNNHLENLKSILVRSVKDDIDLEFDLDDEIGMIKSDPAKIEQVIMNLVINASDAIKESGDITISTSRSELPMYLEKHNTNRFIKLSIQDTGIGIDKTIIHNIYEPFYTTKETGTGLGLSIVYGIVKQSYGYLDIDSQIGVGTRVDVYFPIFQDDDKDDNESHEVSNDETLDHHELLLVGDNPDILNMLEIMLGSQKYVVYKSFSLNEALDMYEKNLDTIDLVISDFNPRSGAGETLITKMESFKPNQKLIIISSKSVDMEKIFPDSTMRIYFLKKPFSQEELFDQVTKILNSD